MEPGEEGILLIYAPIVFKAVCPAKNMREPFLNSDVA